MEFHIFQLNSLMRMFLHVIDICPVVSGFILHHCMVLERFLQTGNPPSGWQEVAVHDPEVQNAANHALKKIQERSNSLLPYELQEVADAKAEVCFFSVL